MSRPARIMSTTGMYHVIFRGLNRQNLFEEENDFEKMVEIIKRVKNEIQFDLFAYCLMTNHVHLFIKEQNTGDIKRIMHKILLIYVGWFNHKYKRTGSLIGNRYKSEPIEDERYCFALTRYIHQNPIKANMVNELYDYKWSSYPAYIAKLQSDEVDSDFILGLFGENREAAVKQFVELHKFFDEERFELSDKKRMDDSQIRRKMLKISGVEKLSDIATLEKASRNKIISKLNKEGISIRQIERFTGISRGVVYREIRKT